MKRVYLCIDLKTFYASVECVERNLDPFQTDLIVADSSRGVGSICLAITPKMKARGVKNRCRVYEIPKDIHPIIAKPRMKKYMEYSAKIYSIYLKYVSKEDIHVYSIDEVFLDVTSYLNLYEMNVWNLAKVILADIYWETGITATAGIGTNLYLAKIALDMLSKSSPTNIGYLNEDLYKEKLWHHTPLTDFWQIGDGIFQRLQKYHIYDMYDVAHCNPNILYKEFGTNAIFLIDHAWGVESCTIQDIKNYKPKARSFSNRQILPKDYDFCTARVVLTEMLDNLVGRLVFNGLSTSNVSVSIGYSHSTIPSLKFSVSFKPATSSYSILLKRVLEEYDLRIQDIKIRKIGISFHNLNVRTVEQLTLFSDSKESENDLLIQKTMNTIQSRFGKNSILRAVSLSLGATQKNRNQLIGGHNAE